MWGYHYYFVDTGALRQAVTWLKEHGGVDCDSSPAMGEHRRAYHEAVAAVRKGAT